MGQIPADIRHQQLSGEKPRRGCTCSRAAEPCQGLPLPLSLPLVPTGSWVLGQCLEEAAPTQARLQEPWLFAARGKGL